MSAPENGGSGPLPPKWQFGAALLLIVGFAVVVIYMLGVADGDGQAWERRTYIFSAVEAIVFTAVGWIFGREVHRQTAEHARQDAEAARAEADAKEGEVRELTEEKAKGRALRAAVEMSGTPVATRRGPAGRDGGGVPGDAAPPDLAQLRDFAARLYDQ